MAQAKQTPDALRADVTRVRRDLTALLARVTGPKSTAAVMTAQKALDRLTELRCDE